MKSLKLSKPLAIMMVGIPGSGKSYFAEKFSEMFKIPYIDPLAIEPLAKDEDAANKLTSFVLSKISQTRESFVLEGNGDTFKSRSEFAYWAKSNGYVPTFIWVQVDKATASSRTLKKNKIDKETFEQIVKSFEKPKISEKTIVISGKHTYISQARTVVANVSKEDVNLPNKKPVEQKGVPSKSIRIIQ